MDSGSGKASGLTGRAPVSGAVVITLASRADSAAAAGTRATAFPVDPSGPTAGFDPACHLVSGNPEYPVDLSTLKGPNSPPWVNACLEARLGLEDVSDAGHQPLVQQGLAKLDRAHGSNIGARPCDLFRTAKDVRSESGQTGIPRQLDRSDQSRFLASLVKRKKCGGRPRARVREWRRGPCALQFRHGLRPNQNRHGANGGVLPRTSRWRLVFHNRLLALSAGVPLTAWSKRPTALILSLWTSRNANISSTGS